MGKEGAGGVVGSRLCAWDGPISQPLHQQLGAEEGKHDSGARLGVQAVGEVDLDAGAFSHKGQRAALGGQGGGQPFSVAATLQLHAGQSGTLFLCFNQAAGFAIHIK